MSMKMKVLDTKKYGDFDVKIYKVEDHDILVYEMKGFITNNYITEYINDLLACAKVHKPKAMIADPRQIKVLSPQVQETVQRDFWPKVAELGMLYNPVITPNSSLSSGSIERMIEGTQIVDLANGHKMEIGTFGSIEEAFEWVSDKLAVH